MASNSAPASEVCSLALKPGVDVNDTGSSASQVWQDVLSTVSKQAGYRSSCYGTALEDPTQLQFIIDWDSYDTSLKFKETPEYKPTMESMITLVREPPRLHHFRPSQFPPTVLSQAPVVEVATFYKTKPSFTENTKKFMDIFHGTEIDGYVGHAYGPVVEKIEKSDGDGKGPALMIFIGWETKEAHMKFRETELFQKNVGLLKEGVGAVEMHHASFKSYQEALTDRFFRDVKVV